MSDEEWSEEEDVNETWDVPAVVEPVVQSGDLDDWSDAATVKKIASPEKEKLLVEKESSPTTVVEKKAVVSEEKKVSKGALVKVQLKHMSDVDQLVSVFIRSKIFPETDGRREKLTVKKAAWKCLKQAVEQKYVMLDTKEAEKFDKELAKQIDIKKQAVIQAEAEAKLEETKREQAAKETREAELKRVAEAKGEVYVNDEDFFAGLE